MTEKLLSNLDNQIEQLISRCHSLQAENDRLKAAYAELKRDSESLASNNKQAKKKVEAVLAKLKSLATHQEDNHD